MMRRPYKLLFPVGAVLGAVGVGHWLVYTLGLQEGYSGDAHALVQVQGFLMAFAAGFLLTMIPRRTGTPPVGTVTVVASAVLVVLSAGAATLEKWTIAHLSFAATLLVLLGVVGRRFLAREAGRRPPAVFVFVPIGLLCGLAGVAFVLGNQHGFVGRNAYVAGWRMITEGVFTCWVVGLGAFVVPLLGGRETPPDADATPASRRLLILHALVGLTLVGSYLVEAVLQSRLGSGVGLRVGLGLRFVLVVFELVVLTQAWRRPRQAGIQRTWVWLANLMVPFGLLLATLFPHSKTAWLHLSFVGGFSLMALSLSAHVVAAHGGHETDTGRRPWPLVTLGILVLMAGLTRASADHHGSYFNHLAYAAALWLLGLGCWLVFVIPRLRDAESPAEGG
ncbi:MAG: NnrS family protein [Acidobacteriota bacterium]